MTEHDNMVEREEQNAPVMYLAKLLEDRKDNLIIYNNFRMAAN